MALKSESPNQPGKERSASEQLERFKEAARQLGTDESEDALDRAMDRLDLRTKPKDEGEKPKTDRAE
jgi:hypothetical protein